MRTRNIFILVGLAGSAAAAAACSSSVTVTQACTDLAKAVCDKFAQCVPPIVTEAWGDSTTCQTREELACNKALSLTNTGETTNNADQCAQAYMTYSCTDAVQNNAPKACQPTPGTLAVGAACGTQSQCASGVCQITSLTGCGTCIAAAGAGAACKATSDCQSGLVCSVSSASDAGVVDSVCVAPVASGGTCSTTPPIVPCGYDLLCSGGKCVAPLTAGSSCTPGMDLCDGTNGYFCTPHGTRCILALFASAGGACGYNTMTGDFTLCSGSGYCGNIDMMTGLGTCEAPAADNAPCDSAKGPLCLPPAACVPTMDGGTAGTCTINDPANCK